jgi:tetratricopeptide (TPR) repeat protein
VNNKIISVSDTIADNVQGQQDIKSLLSQAGKLHAQGRYQPALELCKKAEAIDPEEIGVIFLLSLLYYRTRKYDLSLEYLQKLNKKKPKDHRICRLLGDAYARQGQYNRAYQYYKKAFELKPSNKKILTSLGRMAGKLKHFSEALRYLEELHKKYPEDIQLATCLADLYCEPEIPRFEKAIELCESLPAQEQSKFSVIFILGKANSSLAEKYLHNNNEQKARTHISRSRQAFESIISKDVDNVQAIAQLAYLSWLEDKDHDKAMAELERAIKIDPESEKVWSLKLEIHRQLYQWRMVNKCLSMVRKLQKQG